MKPFWHPLSALYLDKPRALASPTVLRLILAGEGSAAVVYAGDRMWPTLRHGQELAVCPSTSSPKSGDIVLVSDGGVLDVLRVTEADSVIRIAADADPSPEREVSAAMVVGRVVGLQRKRPISGALARLWLDAKEAVARGPDSTEDPADTVREKYDSQAVFYARFEGEELEASLKARLVDSVPSGSSILVAGSGAGRETFAVEALGFKVRGVDFSSNMVAAAASKATRRGSHATFVVGDLRHHEEPAGSLAAVLFTYDVYSFVPRSAERVALLKRLRGWLEPSGKLFLSARRVGGSRDAALLTLQWLARAASRSAGEWGDSHTRWLDASGRLRRSFVRVFSDTQIDQEASLAGFQRQSWEGGHGLFLVRGDPTRRGGI